MNEKVLVNLGALFEERLFSLKFSSNGSTSVLATPSSAATAASAKF